MKFSRFNVVIDDYPQKGHYFCFNTLTKATVVFNQELLDYAQSLDGVTELAEITEEGRDLVEQLMEMQMLCPDRRNETDFLYYWLNSQRHDTQTLMLTILTTYRCNLNCPYCYEKGIDLTPDLDEKLQEDTYNWIIDKLDKFNSKNLSISFLGGEPLLNTQPIDYFAEKFHALAEEKGIGFSFGIVTNGVLLKPEKVKKWRSLGLKSIQVTIDGVKEVHDQMRPFNGGAGSFDIIIANMVKTLQEIPEMELSLRINCSEDNYQRIPELLDYLADLDIDKKQLRISFGYLTPAHESSDEANGSLIDLTKSGKVEVYLAKETKARGLRVVERSLGGPCMTLKKAAFLIDPIGDLYNCWSFVRRAGFKTGSIYEEKMKDFYIEMVGFDVIKECVDCKFAPVCVAGCRNDAFIHFKDPKAKHCRSLFKEEIGKELLKLYFTPDYIEEMAAQEGYDL